MYINRAGFKALHIKMLIKQKREREIGQMQAVSAPSSNRVNMLEDLITIKINFTQLKYYGM
jgi:hypothetical protein